MLRLLLASCFSLAVLSGCSGFEKKCSTNGECDAANYCNVELGACFGRDSDLVPTITSVTVGPTTGHITVVGTGPANATISIFTDDQCVAAPVGSSQASATGAFTVDAVAPASGRVRATAEVGGIESICSSFTQYP